jgi:hypothetical protein
MLCIRRLYTVRLADPGDADMMCADVLLYIGAVQAPSPPDEGQFTTKRDSVQRVSESGALKKLRGIIKCTRHPTHTCRNRTYVLRAEGVSVSVLYI